ncbi:MAG: GDP-mannose 4,6-dehydratase [Acidobacteriota bacterium]
MKTILITGGAGFIGSNFVRHLFYKYPDYRLLVLDLLTYAGNPENLPDEIKESNRFEFWYGNVNNGGLVDMLVAKSDAVVHFAAESHVARSIFDDRIFFETDVLGTQTVASTVLEHSRVERFIHISTSEVYGTAITAPMTEEHPLNPMTPYASAKAGADRLVYSYWATYDLPAVIVRPFNQYGPYQHLEKVIPRFITSALLDTPLTVHGDGSSRRDWTYVSDTCEAIDRVLHAKLDTVKGKVINIGSGCDLDVLAIAKKILNLMDKPASLIQFIGERPGQVQHHIASTVCAEQLLEWRATTNFEAGLTKTIEWYRKNLDWWKKLLWMKHVPIKTRTGKVEYY